MTPMPAAPSPLRGWFRRTPAGWALLAASAALALFYLHVVRTALNPDVSEAHRRTFITGEFAVFPQSRVFLPGDGLAYAPGATVEVATFRGRAHLARFDWWRFAVPKPWLKKQDGRVFLSVPEPLRRPDLPHRLRLEIACAYPSGASALLAVSVNGAPLGQAICAQGLVAFERDLPAGLFPAGAYEEIRISRPGLNWVERLAIGLGLRYDAVALERFSITPLE